MTKRKTRPRFGVETPFPSYFLPGIAVRKAVNELLKGEEEKIEIDCEKYNEVAWKLVAKSHKRMKATLKQVCDECDQIYKTASRLLNLLNNASAPTVNALDRTMIGHGVESTRFDLLNAHFEIVGLMQATQQAKTATESGVEPEGLKGRGPEANDIVDEIGDMIADDYWRLMIKSPGLIRERSKSDGCDELRGDFVNFFRQIFEAIVPNRDFETPAKHAARRWKERHLTVTIEK